MKKKILKIATWTLASLVGTGAGNAVAQGSYPTKAIEIVVPYAPGGSADFSARQLANRLETRLGQTVSVVNRPGASGSIGVTSVARAPADGHTLLLALNTELVIIPSLGKKLPYALDNFEPISMVGTTPLVLLGRKDFKAKDLQGLIQEMKTTPGNYSFGGAPGSPAHISGEWLKQLTGAPIGHVPYKGGAQAATDVAGGHLDLYFSGILPARSVIQTGSVVPYATTSSTRSSLLPNVPTMEEAGVGQLVMGNWTALLTPKGTPPAALVTLKRHVDEIVNDAGFQSALRSQGIEPLHQEPAAPFLAREEKKYGELIRTLQISQ